MARWPPSKDLLQIAATAGLVALLLGGYLLSGCPQPVAMALAGERGYSSPDRERSADIDVDRLASGAHTYRITVRPYTDWRHRDSLPRRVPSWSSEGVRPLYVFWLDGDSIEVIVLETDRAGFGSVRSRIVDGVDVVTRVAATTAMHEVLLSPALPDLPSGPPG